MAVPKLFAYAGDVSVRPGETVDVMVSAEATDTAAIELVRIIHGDEHHLGPGYLEEVVDAGLPDTIPVSLQFHQQGSGFVIDDPDGRLAGDRSFAVSTFVWPSHIGHGREAIVGTYDIPTATGWALGIDPDGFLEFWVGDGHDTDSVRCEIPMMGAVWFWVGVRYDHRRRLVRLQQVPIITMSNSAIGFGVPIDLGSSVVERMKRRVKASPRSCAISGSWDDNDRRGEHRRWMFNGKIDRPAVLASTDDWDELSEGATPKDPIAAWDTTADVAPGGIPFDLTDVGPHGLHARAHNSPMRGTTGAFWNGDSDCFADDPQNFGGVYLADSAMTDCDWDPTITVTVPDDARSGCYALKLTSGPAEEFAPFFVRPHRATAPVAFLAATFSYLAYANESLSFDAPVAQSIVGHTPILSAPDVERYKQGVFGMSTYDTHTDGLQGNAFSGWRRPIANMRPKYRSSSIGCPWQYPADLSIVAWLEHSEFDYDVITDHDMHREGAALLNDYQVVITGTHSEYYSHEMMDAIEGFIDDGGRFIYMGGNGMYWVTSMVDDGSVIEVRKLEGGTRAWQARPGDYHHATDGVRGGVWKNRQRGPHKTMGVGFASEGFDFSSYYRRSPQSFDPAVAWLFEGVDGETFGHEGLGMGGAAGLEIDRFDEALGSPARTWVLASSEGHSTSYPLVVEDIFTNRPGLAGPTSPLVRADITITTSPSGGVSFCPASIAWGQALPVQDYDSDAARIMTNAVRRFLDPTPIELPDPPDAQDDAVIEAWAHRFGPRIVDSLGEGARERIVEHPFGPYDDVTSRALGFVNCAESASDAHRTTIVVDGDAWFVTDAAGKRTGPFDSVEAAGAAAVNARLDAWSGADT